MEHLYVTVIGGDTASHAERIFDDLRLKSINQINDGALGRLGNFKTYTYIFELPEEEVIERRKKLMKALIGESAEWCGMYEHGDWMQLYLFRRFVQKEFESLQ